MERLYREKIKQQTTVKTKVIVEAGNQTDTTQVEKSN